MIKYGLIGYPLEHSFSKAFFTQKFKTEKIDAEYENFEIEEISSIIELIENLPNLTGLNVTIPYKEKVLPYLHRIEPSAKKIGAVNTIKIIRKESDIQLEGFNTDTYGFEESLTPLLKEHHQKALILGTGGASKAVAYVLNKLNIEATFISRKKSNKNTDYQSINKEEITKNTIIVNTTPLGTYPNINAAPDIPYQYLTTQHLLYDLVYNPEKTLFLQQGEKQGATIKNGYQMLTLQALKAYRIWNQQKI